jgi:hypothetical protein
MQIEATRQLFTVRGTRHIACVIDANRVLTVAFRERAFVSLQLPLRLSGSEPRPRS